MTMRDPDMRDPEIGNRTTVRGGNGAPWGWIAGAIVVVLLLGAIAYSWNNEPTNTASNPSASAPASTTGSAPAKTPSSNTPPANAPAR